MKNVAPQEQAALMIQNLKENNVLFGIVERMSESWEMLQHVIDKEEELNDLFELFGKFNKKDIYVKNESALSSKLVLAEVKKDVEFMKVFKEYVKYDEMVYHFALGQHMQQYEDYKRQTTFTNIKCLDPEGPQPFILMSLGRSGSGVTFQVLANLTGMETPSEEYIGSGPAKANQFFSRINDDSGSWVTKKLCEKQQLYPDAGIVGFKWKPFIKSMNSPAALDGLKLIAELQNPTIKIVRLRRNLLDVYLSNLKHKKYKQRVPEGIPAHCVQGNKECAEKHRLDGANMTENVDDAMSFLESRTREEDKVDAMLKSLKVPHVNVAYDNLYHSDTTKEWMKIFSFLSVGPAKGAGCQQV